MTDEREKTEESLDLFMTIVNQHRVELQCPEEQDAWNAEQKPETVQTKREALEMIAQAEAELSKGKKMTSEYAYEENQPLKHFPMAYYTTVVPLVDDTKAVNVTTALCWHWMLNFTQTEIQQAADIIGEIQATWYECVQPAKQFLAALRTMNVIYKSNRYRRSLVVALALVVARKKVSEKANQAREAAEAAEF